jgi:hypothetical protein
MENWYFSVRIDGNKYNRHGRIMFLVGLEISKRVILKATLMASHGINICILDGMEKDLPICLFLY